MKEHRFSLMFLMIIAGYGVAVLLNLGATQYIAARFDFDGGLGVPLLGSLYSPFSWVEWSADFYDADPAGFQTVWIVISVIFLSFSLFALLYNGIFNRSAAGHEGVHGTAHWASKKEVEEAGLLAKNSENNASVYVGGWTDGKGRVNYLRHSGPEHVVVIAPTRSGKGVGLIIPTLLSWSESCVVHDPKGELWQLTSGWRSQNIGPCYLFNPVSSEFHVRINPLDEIRIGTPNEVSDAQNLASIIIDPAGKGLNDHWTKSAHSLMTGLLLHVLHMKDKQGEIASMHDVSRALSDPEKDANALFEDMATNTWHENGQRQETVAAAGQDMLNKPKGERGSVLSTAVSFLSVYRDPLIAANTSDATLRIRDLVDGDKPVSLYIMLREEDKDRLMPVARVLLTQLIRVLLRPELQFENGKQVPPYKHRLLLLLDEFPSFGKLGVLEEALSYIAGYGIKAYLIMQDMSQLWKSYGRDESIISNSHVRVVYTPNKVETAEYISRMVGQTTVVKEDISASGRRYSSSLKNVTTRFSEVSRSLITPDEVLRLKGPTKAGDGSILSAGEMITFIAGHAPIKGTQILYFKDDVFHRRSLCSPPQRGSSLKPFTL